MAGGRGGGDPAEGWAGFGEICQRKWLTTFFSLPTNKDQDDNINVQIIERDSGLLTKSTP